MSRALYSVDCNPKKWAKDRRARKFTNPRDRRKSTPNGGDLRRGPYYSAMDQDKIHQGNFRRADSILAGNQRNPLRRRLKTATWIEKEWSEILNSDEMRPDEIVYHPIGMVRDPKGCSADVQVWGRGGRNVVNAVSFIWRDTDKRVDRLIQDDFIKKKLATRKDSIKLSHVKVSHSRANGRGGRVYRPPNIVEPLIKFNQSTTIWSKSELKRRIQKIGRDAGEKHSLIIDLKTNHRVYGFGTLYQWQSRRRKPSRQVRGINGYKLYGAVDKIQFNSKMDKILSKDPLEGSQSKLKKKGMSVDKEKCRRSGSERKMKNKKKKGKNRDGSSLDELDSLKLNRKLDLEWTHLGTFDGSLNGYLVDLSRSFRMIKSHRIKNEMPFYESSNLKHLKRNGFTCRWIKLVPLDRTIKWFQDKKRLECKVFGLKLDEMNQPIPTGNASLFVTKENDENEDEYSGESTTDSSDSDKFADSETLLSWGYSKLLRKPDFEGVQLTFAKPRAKIKWSRNFEARMCSGCCSMKWMRDELQSQKTQAERELKWIRKGAYIHSEPEYETDWDPEFHVNESLKELPWHGVHFYD